MKKNANDAVLFSHAEFDALPHSVQRKYFSSLERLRIAEKQSVQEHHQHESSRRSSQSHTRSIALHHSTLGLTRRRLVKKAERVRLEHEVAQREAEFFLSLPPKVQKLHFSREEQVLLVGRCDQPLIPEVAEQRFDDFHFDFRDDSDSNNDRVERGRTRRRSRSISPTRAPFSKRKQTEALHIDTMTPPASHQVAKPPSFRRTLSLTNMPVRHSTSSAPPLMDPPLLNFGPTQWRHRSSSVTSRSGRRSSHTPAPIPPVFDPEATHYQDPEARKKLRMFLGSAQKFDEAVEFGFPSSAGDDTITPRYQLPPITTDARNFSRDMQTFLRDDRVSFLEDNGDEDAKSDSDGESLTDLESPVTPSSTGLSFRHHIRGLSPSNFSSLDSTGLPPLHPIQGRLNREMTLRMTLTRPDLRADEEQLYGWQGQKGTRDDPFALEELHLSDDMTGSHGAFAIKPKSHGNLVSRLFKRASKQIR